MREHCDVCGKRHHDIRMDKRIKEITGLEVHICLDCYAWMDDEDRYDALLNEGVINDSEFIALVFEEGK